VSRPRLLDLFCGAGGAAMGYHRAGFDVVGIDIEPQPHYPFEFVQDDALFCLKRIKAGLWEFDAIHASPPCQAYSVLRRANPGAEYPDLVAPTREMLEATGLPWVMENVPGAPLLPSIVLCGSMFDLGAGDRQLRRHRLFESSVGMLQPQCAHEGEAIGVYGGSPTGRYTFENGIRKGLKGRRGGYQGTMDERREAMGVGWMTSKELNNAIPPAYTEWIGVQLLRHLELAPIQVTCPHCERWDHLTCPRGIDCHEGPCPPPIQEKP
jgi:DNA (cytosine-5)-methyltransferase 1